MKSISATSVTGVSNQARPRMRGQFPRRLFFAAPALLLLSGTAWGVGDVDAYVDHRGNLVIVGDSESNSIFVGRTGGQNETLIEGEFWEGGPTTVNGQPWVVLTAPAERIRIDLNDGNDRIRLDGQHPGSVSIEGGRGDDVLAIGDPVVGGDLDIDAGPGNDLVDIQDSLVVGDFSVTMGSGADLVIAFFAFIDGDTSIDTGAGPDSVDFSHSEFGGDLEVNLGSGEDHFEYNGLSVGGDTRVKGGPKEDTYVDGGGNRFEGRSRIKQ